MKTKLIVLKDRDRIWFIGNAMPKHGRDGTIQYIGYSVQNTNGFEYIGSSPGTCNYFYIK